MSAVANASPGRYEVLYEMLLEAIPSSLLVIDQALRIVWANRNFLEKARRPRSTTIGMHLEDVLPPVILDQLDMARRIRQVFEKGEPTAGERMTYRAPGVPMRIYYYRVLPFCWKGSVENVVLLMDDVTEQIQLSEEIRRVERHLASVVQSASDIVVSTDTAGRILTWNTAAEKISGYSSEEMKGQFLFARCSPEHQEEMKSAFSRVKSQQNPAVEEWNLITKDQRGVPVAWVLSPMKDDDGETVGMVAVGRDLTERRKLEKQLLQSQKLAALGVMAGGIAHEVRNPLAICASAAQFLMEDSVTAEFRRECAAKIHAAVQRASAIIENLLGFARPAGQIEMKPTDLVSVLRDTVALVANQAKVQNVALACRFPDGCLLIEGVANLLQQAFLNLFLNALAAMPNGGRLSVSAEQNNGTVSVCVADTGRGIPPADIDSIFDPFYTTSAPGKGTGLGLSLCYSIIKQHLGSIEVASIPGQGSTFTIRLPLRSPGGMIRKTAKSHA
jgi:PAS domain S-box-containing protein